MPSSWKRGNQQLNSEHPVPRGRPPKRCAGTSQNPNQRQNHLVLSNQVSSIDNNPHSAGNLQLFSADQLEKLRTMIEDKVSESSRDIATEAARAAVTALRNQNSVASAQLHKEIQIQKELPIHQGIQLHQAIQIHFVTTLSHHNCQQFPSQTRTSLHRT